MCEFNNRNAIFYPTANPNAAQKREIWGCIFNFRKLRQIGAVNNNGDPHFFRNGGQLINIIGWSVISDGVGIKTVHKHRQPRRIPSIPDSKKVAVNTEIPTVPIANGGGFVSGHLSSLSRYVIHILMF